MLAAGDFRFQDLSQEPSKTELRHLFAPLDHLLVCGGDARLTVDPVSRRNIYGCQPFPLSDALNFSSSTATSISARAYERVDHARASLMQSVISHGLDTAFDDRIEEMRDELKALLGLRHTETQVVFSASGTDAQLHALFLAHSALGSPLTSIIVAADQTGSGTAHTAYGRHFSDITANGGSVRKGEPITGLADFVSSIALSSTKPNGEFYTSDEMDLLVLSTVEKVVADGSKVLLQVMDSSKLGWQAPSDQCLAEVSRRWPRAVQIVVDACQMRLGRRRLGTYLDRGYMVLITGSKFFTGPPFSGALLVPNRVAHAIDAATVVPFALRDYGARSDWPKCWEVLRSYFPARPNFGQWLRWEAALEEIRAYYRIPDTFRRSAVFELGVGIAESIAKSSSLQLLQRNPPNDDANDEEQDATTIFPFTIKRDGQILGLSACKEVHRALAIDAGEAIPSAEAPVSDVVTKTCFVGQPVELGGNGLGISVLRICIGARHISEMWSPDLQVAHQNLKRLLEEVAVIVAKIEWLLDHGDQRKIMAEAHGH